MDKNHNQRVKLLSEFSKQFFKPDYDTRNTVDSKQTNKIIVTEEALDDWQAQSINVPYDKFIKHKRLMQSLNNQGNAESSKKGGKTLQNKNWETMMKKQQAQMASINLMKQANQAPLKKYNELKPKLYAKHHNVQSYVIQLADNEEHSSPHQRSQPVQSQFDKKNLSMRKGSYMKNYTQNQKELLREIGGLPKRILSSYGRRIKSKSTNNPYATHMVKSYYTNPNTELPEYEKTSKLNQSSLTITKANSLVRDSSPDKKLNSPLKSSNYRVKSMEMQSIYNTNPDKRNLFWATDPLQNTQISIKEQTFYSTFSKSNAQSQGQEIFNKNKNETTQQYLNKFQSSLDLIQSAAKLDQKQEKSLMEELTYEDKNFLQDHIETLILDRFVQKKNQMLFDDSKPIIDLDQIYFLLAQRYFQMGKPQQAKRFIEEAILVVKDEKLLKREKVHLLYKRAKCNRVLHQYALAQKDYNYLEREFKLEEGKKIAKYIFGMILMPLEINRKKIMEYTEGFQGILDQYEVQKDRSLLIQHYLEAQDKNAYIGENENPKWLDKSLPQVITTIRSLPFFNRFSLNRQREFMEKIQLRMIKRNSLLFFKSNEVYVLISGSILMRFHGENILLPQTYSKFGVGDVLNFKQETSQIFNSVDTWFYAQVDTEIGVFDKQYFDHAWSDLLQNDKLVLKYTISCHPMFKKMNELTLMTLVYEMFEERTFLKGQIIMSQAKQAPTNYYYRPYFEARLSKIAVNIKKKKKGMDSSGASSLVQRSQEMENLLQQRNADNGSRLSFKETREQSGSFKKNEARGENNIHLLTGERKGFFELPNYDHKLQEMYKIKEEKEYEDSSDSDLDEKKQCFALGEVEADGLYIIDEGQQSEKVTCLFIANDKFKKIPVYEQLVMRQFCLAREDISMLAYLFSNKYQIDIKEYATFYGT